MQDSIYLSSMNACKVKCRFEGQLIAVLFHFDHLKAGVKGTLDSYSVCESVYWYDSL